MCVFRLHDVVQLLFTLVAFITKVSIALSYIVRLTG